MSRARLLTSLLCSFLCLPVVAQQKSPGESPVGGKGGLRAANQDNPGGFVDEGFGDGKGEGKGKEGFELDKEPPVQRARGHCRFDAVINPKRLLPGQSGVLTVTMIMEGSSILQSPPPLQVRGTGAMPVGDWTIRPAKRGELAPAYRGQPVYDNWAVLEMPVTMPTDARLGEKRYAGLDLEFDLNHGETGQPLGHFRENVSVACEVGLPPARPQVAPGAGGAPQAVPAASGTDGAEKEASAVAPSVPPLPVAPATSSPAAAEVADPAPQLAPSATSQSVGPSAPLEVSVAGDTSVLVIAVGAALALVLGFMILRKR